MEIEILKNSKNKYGQYFTPEVIVDFMIDLADLSKNSKILEPSCGEGIFIEKLLNRGYQQIDAYEIDKTLANEFSFVKYESFISAEIIEKYDLVIGNPPYIRWKNLEDELKFELSNNQLWNQYFNSLCDYLYIFILKSIEVLNDSGQLIFICPEYWMNTTHSITLRNYMVKNGYFEEIYHFNETPIFEKVTVSIVIFKFVKSKKTISNKIKIAKYFSNQKLTPSILESLKKKCSTVDAEYIEVNQFLPNSRWMIHSDDLKEKLFKFEENCLKQFQNNLYSILNQNRKEFHTIGEICDIGNGLVSGLDKAFQIHSNNLTELEKTSTIKVIKAKNLIPYTYGEVTNYIFIQNIIDENILRDQYPNFYNHLKDYKSDLENRYQYNRSINYWEWVFLRNFNLFSKPSKRIFVPCKERISNKNYFRFSFVESGIFPTQDVTAIFKKDSTKESIEYILAFLNHPTVFDWLRCNGIVKGNIVEFSEKPISSIPFRKINWENPLEVELHARISKCTNDYISDSNDQILVEINELFEELFNIK